MEDLRGFFCYKLWAICFRILTVLITFYCKIELSIKGVKYGKKIKFLGFSRISRAHKSQITIGNNCKFRSGYFFNKMGINKKCYLATLKEGAEIVIGDNVGMSGAVVTSAGKVSIGNNVLLGAESFITDYDWHGTKFDMRSRPSAPKEVVIEENVWIGYNAIVLKGVRIGKNSVIGANSVVTKDVPENVIAAGNPCRIVKNLLAL